MPLLAIGTQAPNFSLLNQKAEEVALADFRGKWVVVYFYPKDDTKGCTAEACSFRDSYEDFVACGAEVIGISSDSHDSHSRFVAKYDLPFQLLSDPKAKVRKAFGVPNTLFFIHGRTTFVINPEGKIAHVFNNQLRFAKHVEEALRIIKSAC